MRLRALFVRQSHQVELAVSRIRPLGGIVVLNQVLLYNVMFSLFDTLYHQSANEVRHRLGRIGNARVLCYLVGFGHLNFLFMTNLD